MKRKTLSLALSLIFILSILVSCGQQYMKGTQSSVVGDGDIRRVKITSDLANIYLGADDGSTVLQTSPKDTKLDVIGQIENWYAVRTANNRIGFCPKSAGTPVITGQKPSLNTNGQQAGMSQQTGNGTDGANGTNGNNGRNGTNGTTATGQPKIPNNTSSNSTSLTAEEQEMLKLVNQARAQNNVPPLQIDMQVENVARLKSQDMINNNYFSHNSPTYGSPFDMMKNFGIEFIKAGENIAGNQSVQAAHNALMNSPGHRQNILDPSYTHVGIGIKKGSSYGYIFTQDFISKPQ